MLKSAFILSIGTLLEWAEFVFFAYLAGKFALLFFPELSRAAATLSIFAVFGVGLLARPLGALIFGALGDRVGRKYALTCSVWVMGFATVLMGCLPDFQQIGLWAPVVLVLLRIVQGLSLSGEFMGAAIYLVETRWPGWQYLPSSLVSMFSALGMLLGALFAYIVTRHGLPAWSWRVPYWFGGALCVLAGVMRLKLLESDIFVELKRRQQVLKRPLRVLWRKHRQPMLMVFLVATFICFYVYTCNVWWTHYALQYFKAARELNLWAQAWVVVLTPLAAILAERVGAEKMLCLGLTGAMFASVLLFWVTSMSAFYLTAITLLLYAVFDACVTGVMFVYFARILPAEIRYSGQAVGWNFSVAIMGSMVAFIAQGLAETGMSVAPALGVVVAAGSALLGVNWYARRFH